MGRAILIGGLTAIVLSSGCAEMGVRDVAGPIIGGPIGSIISKSGDRAYWSEKLKNTGLENNYGEQVRELYQDDQNVIFACNSTTRKTIDAEGIDNSAGYFFPWDGGEFKDFINIKNTFDNDEKTIIICRPRMNGDHHKKEIYVDLYNLNEEKGGFDLIRSVHIPYKHNKYMKNATEAIFSVHADDKTLGKKKAVLRIGNQEVCETIFKIIDEDAPKIAPKVLPTKPELIKALKDAADLKQQGTITEEEYQRMRKDLMKQIDAN